MREQLCSASDLKLCTEMQVQREFKSDAVHSCSCAQQLKDVLKCSAAVTSLMSCAGRGDMLRGFDFAHLCKVDQVPNVGPVQPTVLVKVEEKGKMQQVCSSGLHHPRCPSCKHQKAAEVIALCNAASCSNNCRFVHESFL